MIAALSTLDTPLGPKLVRPFYIAGSALALLLAGIGLLSGVAAMTTSATIGLFLIALGGLLGVTVFLGVRIVAEAATIVFSRPGRPAGSVVSRTA